MKVTIDLPNGVEGMAERIRFLMFSHKTTQAELAQLLGVSTQAVRWYLNGRTKIRLESAVAICEFFGVSLAWLIVGEDDKIKED